MRRLALQLAATCIAMFFAQASAAQPIVLDLNGVQNVDNLRSIGLALLNHESAFTRFPGEYVGAAGTPLLSWRVSLLPFLGYQSLYNQFDLSKAWDDPANLPLLQQMPAVYRGPLDPAGSTSTRYVAGTGMNTMFDGPIGFRLVDVPDGTSNTIFVGETQGTAIPWTKPEDIVVGPSPTLGAGGFASFIAGGVPFAFVDGSVRIVPDGIDSPTLLGLFLRNDGLGDAGVTLAYVIAGDFDGNNSYDCDDVEMLSVAIVAGTNAVEFDLDGDALVNLADLDAWLALAGRVNLGPGMVYPPGDINLDGLVDGQDFVAWNGLGSPAPASGFCDGDFNADGMRDQTDLNILCANAPAGICPAAFSLIALNDVAQSEGVDELVAINDPASGIGTLIGSLGDNFIETEAMAVRFVLAKANGHSNQSALSSPGMAEQIFAVDNDRLLQLDPTTGNGTEIGPIGFPDVDGIAFSPADGMLYGVTYGSNQLIRIDPNTGMGTLVASDVIVGRRLEDIAFAPNGNAYVLTSGPRIYQIDLATGEKLARWVLSGASSLESMIWSPDGTMLYSAADRNGTKDLVTIQLSATDETGTISFVSADPSGFGDIEALIFLRRVTFDLLQAAYAETPVDADARLPHKMQLRQNVPNPFNPSTQIHFELAAPSHVELTVFDVAGRQVTSLLSGHRSAGSYSVQWNGRTARGQMAAAGVYQYVLRTASGVESRRMVLVK